MPTETLQKSAQRRFDRKGKKERLMKEENRKILGFEDNDYYAENNTRLTSFMLIIIIIPWATGSLLGDNFTHFPNIILLHRRMT